MRRVVRVKRVAGVISEYRGVSSAIGGAMQRVYTFMFMRGQHRRTEDLSRIHPQAVSDAVEDGIIAIEALYPRRPVVMSESGNSDPFKWAANFKRVVGGGLWVSPRAGIVSIQESRLADSLSPVEIVCNELMKQVFASTLASTSWGL